MSKDDFGIAVLVFTGFALLLAFLYGILVYNNTQNIKRDEFYATHCRDVTKSEAVFSNQYICGAKR